MEECWCRGVVYRSRIPESNSPFFLRASFVYISLGHDLSPTILFFFTLPSFFPMLIPLSQSLREREAFSFKSRWYLKGGDEAHDISRATIDVPWIRKEGWRGGGGGGGVRAKRCGKEWPEVAQRSIHYVPRYLFIIFFSRLMLHLLVIARFIFSFSIKNVCKLGKLYYYYIFSPGIMRVIFNQAPLRLSLNWVTDPSSLWAYLYFPPIYRWALLSRVSLRLVSRFTLKLFRVNHREIYVYYIRKRASRVISPWIPHGDRYALEKTEERDCLSSSKPIPNCNCTYK